MKTYKITEQETINKIYYVTASNEADAREQWEEGQLVNCETDCESDEIISIEEEANP